MTDRPPEAWTARFAVPASHPCLPGHFPGRPVVPGVVLLDAVMEAAGAAGLGPVAALPRAKFTAPVGPEEPVELRLWRVGERRLGFAGSCRGVPALSGEMELDAAGPGGDGLGEVGPGGDGAA